MKRGSKHQLNKKTLLFIAIFSIALFVFPQKILAVESYLVDETISWLYLEGHLYLNFEADVTTDEMFIEPNNWLSLWTGGNSNMDGKTEEDFSVVDGGYYSKPIIWVKCDDYAPIIENAEGVTPVQILTLPCVDANFTGDGSHYVDEITYDFLQDLDVWVGESKLLARPWVFFTETLTPPTLEATFPPTGETTNVGLGSFTATGDFDLGIMAWLYLRIDFSTATTTYSFYSDAFEIDEWSGSYAISVNLLYAGTYDVNYAFINIYCYEKVCYFEDLVIYEVPIATTTLIVNIEMKPEWLDFIETDYFIGEEPEEGTIQHFIWLFHKFQIGLIVPSKEVRISFLNMVLKIQTLFPYNYIEATKDWFSNLEESVEQDPTLEISLFGAEVETIPFSFWEANITIRSQTKPLFGWVLTIMTFILWGGFLIFAINFIKRIL